MPYRSAISLTGIAGFGLFMFILLQFPGKQTPIALSLATGWNIPALQQQVDTLEDKAIRREAFTDADRAFLADLYSVGAKGGKLTRFVPVGSQLVERYLSATGEDFELDPAFIQRSRPVQQQMQGLKDFLNWQLTHGQALQPEYASGVFYMGDPAEFDLVTSLYFGELFLKPTVDAQGQLKLSWRVEMPWVWPTYPELYAKYGTYHAQNFALPNLRSLFGGRRHMLQVDDGLGGHLPALGLAKPFRVYAQWDE